MHDTSNSVLWRLIQRVHRTLNKTAQDAIQRAHIEYNYHLFKCLLVTRIASQILISRVVLRKW